jgi:chromate transport protein ChrA
LWRIAWYFTEAGAFVFGSGLAIVPFLRAGVVQEFGWLDERQFLDAVAVAMITPGPVVITVAFIGYLVAGFAGACVAALATFLPCYVFTVVPAPHFERLSRNAAVKAFVDGVTAAATGAIAGAAVVLARRALVDVPTVLIAAAAVGLLVASKKVPEPLVIVAAGVAGVLIQSGGNVAATQERRASRAEVVFVCEHGSVKSVIAAEWFNRLAAERGLGVRASARGVDVDPAIPDAVARHLAADGFDVSGFKPTAAGGAELASAARVVSFGVRLDVAAVVWNGVPPASERYEASRDDIRARVAALVDELAARK